MGNKISNQERANEINKNDLILMSKSLNEYNSAWKSNAITFDNLSESLNKDFRKDKFKDVLDTIQEIYDQYLNSKNLSISFDSPKKEIQLISEDGVFSKFDASELILSGIIKEIKRIKIDGIPYIRFEIYIDDGKKTKQIDIPLGDFIDIYTPGNGLCCEEKQFYIDEAVVATNDYVDNEITSISTMLNQKIDDNYNDLTSTISSVSSDIQEDLNETYTQLTSIISSVSSDIEEDITDNYNGLTSIISSISTDLDDKIDNNYSELTDTISSISTDIEQEIEENYEELTNIVSSVSSYLSTEISINYAKKTELSTYTNGKGLDLNDRNEFSVKDEVSANALSEAKKWVNQQNYTTYDNARNNLSNDGYSMKVTFRDWED